MNKPDLILTSDWHLREDQPICRTDDFWKAQWDKVGQVIRLAADYGCPILHAGDLFHYWKPSPYLLSTAITYLVERFYTVAGQHDLPQHNLELYHKCGIKVLGVSTPLSFLRKGSFGQPPGKLKIKDRIVGVWHKFVWDGKKIPWPGCDEMTAEQVLKKYTEFDLIVTGDHHKPFTERLDGRLLVNPGCLTRQAADYADHLPRVYLWYAATNEVKVEYLDIEEGVVSRQHIEKREEIDKRIEAFISRLSDDWEVVVSFEENLKRFLATNRVRRSVVELIYKAIDNE